MALGACLIASVTTAQADERWRHGPGPGPMAGPWHGDIHRFHEHDFERWRGGAWTHGWHEGRSGWWWVVGGIWYFYPAPVYPYPDPYRPPMFAGPVPAGEVVYYCQNPAGYYPYVAECFAPWQAVPVASPPPVVQPMPQPVPAPAPQGGMDKTTGGTIIGGVVGGVAGAQFGHGSGKVAAAVAGTLLGAFIGHEAGASLDRADQLAADRAAQNAYQAQMGQSIAWNNPDNGHSGTIVPVREGQDQAGNYCREFQQTITVEGRTEQAFGRACRQPDGAWKVVQ